MEWESQVDGEGKVRRGGRRKKRTKQDEKEEDERRGRKKRTKRLRRKDALSRELAPCSSGVRM